MSKQEKQPDRKDDKQSRDTGDRLRSYAKYSGMAFQMGAIILVGTLIGKKLDEYFQTERPYLTVAFALFSTFGALYLTLKDLITTKDDK